MAQTAKYLVLDTESTGLLPGKHGLIQLACASLDENLDILNQFCLDVRPPEGTVLDPEALEINGFTSDRINQGVSYQTAAQLLLAFLQQEFANEPIVIAQFYPADYAILLELCKQTGSIGSELHRKIGNSVLDTKTVVILLNLLRQKSGRDPIFPIVSLSKPGGVKDVLEIGGHRAHDALGDVLATREVLKKLLDFFNLS